jgi:hypothetical protein
MMNRKCETLDANEEFMQDICQKTPAYKAQLEGLTCRQGSSNEIDLRRQCV